MLLTFCGWPFVRGFPAGRESGGLRSRLTDSTRPHFFAGAALSQCKFSTNRRHAGYTVFIMGAREAVITPTSDHNHVPRRLFASSLAARSCAPLVTVQTSAVRRQNICRRTANGRNRLAEYQ